MTDNHSNATVFTVIKCGSCCAKCTILYNKEAESRDYFAIGATLSLFKLHSGLWQFVIAV